jgi:acetyl-CoA synthetase
MTKIVTVISSFSHPTSHISPQKSQPMDTTISDHGLPTEERYVPKPPGDREWHVASNEEYERMYKDSLEDPSEFWSSHARKTIDWIRPFDKVVSGDLVHGDVAWFLNGQLNVSYNCVDRWAMIDPERIALIAEGDEPTDVEKVTYRDLLHRVCKMANVLKFEGGVRKGDTVTLYMPTGPDLVVTMLACARIGAVHSVVFAGFSAANLRERITDAKSQIVVCSSESRRGGKIINLQKIVNEAVEGNELVEKVFCFGQSDFTNPKWVSGQSACESQRPYCPCEPMDSEDLLFLLYTSGSTGKPKAVAHTTAGYLLYASMTHKYIFDVHAGDVWACMADLGWITGHTYGVYGPLVNGNSTFLFESIPTYPNAGRYWDVVARHKITHFYTAPTALRTLMKFGDEFVKQHDRSSLRVLGSVGEPINPEAWRWYYEIIGEGRCPIIDSYWQTETGGIVVAPLACRTLKPGSATLPFFGIDPVIVDPLTGNELIGNSVHGYLGFRKPWPGMLRTILGDHERFMTGYLKIFPGLYVTGDGCVRDSEGYLWITGRVDDVIKVSGHRMGSAEIEHALVQNELVSEAAVVGFPHAVKGEGLFCYVSLKERGDTELDVEKIIANLKMTVRKFIGPVATPDIIVLTQNLPKTRSGKIMRRVLRKLAHGEGDQLGDLSTLADPAVVPPLKHQVESALSAFK